MPKKSASKLFQEEEKKELAEQVEEKPTKPIQENLHDKGVILAKTSVPEDDDIVDIDFSVIKKKKFRINNDNSKILELNTSDMRIATRLKEAYPRLNQLMDEVTDKIAELPEGDDIDEKQLVQLSKVIEDIDKAMRVEVDYIFDANVSEICGSDGSMWDPIEGAFRYEHIIDKLAKLYENNLDKEFMEMKRRVETKTGKYAKLQDHKRKQK